MPLGLIGKKLGHTRVYDELGQVVAVTVVLAGPNRVLQIKSKSGKDGYNAVQLGFGDQKAHRLSRPKLGHLAKFGACDFKAIKEAAKAVSETREGAGYPAAELGELTRTLAGVQRIREFRDFSKEVKTGDLLGANLFAKGDFVDVIGVTKGRGFEGVVKRHRFRGGDSTHGAKGWHRRSGAIGQRLFPGTVMRGMKMPGHMGQVRRTTQNLEVIQVREADNVLLIKGAIPGAEGDYVIIRESKKIPKDGARHKAILEARRKAAETLAAEKAGKGAAKADKKAAPAKK
jgi:large subunit ribosomal protein L3